MTNPLEILQQYWGHHSFRPLQEEIILSVLSKKDTVALLPTGGGKSICFQVPALINEGLCIVVSPLIALMNDQVNALTKMGIKSMALTGGISYADLDRMLDNCIYGNYKFLYLSPERLQQELVQQRIEKMQVNLIAIDEAHCISQWGNDFRPAYKNVNLLRNLKPGVPFIALTATATPDVLSDTINELELVEPSIYQNSFFRENLSYQVWKEEDKFYRIRQLLEKQQAAIIYTRNRKSTEEISKQLNLEGIKSTFFHGGLNTSEKNKRLNNWLDETIPVMVATSAFGMGIDKTNLHIVIHIDLPESLESFFQEAGRVGRDGAYSKAILLYNEADKSQVYRQFISNLPTIDFLKLIYRKLCNHFYTAYGEGAFTTHAFNFEKFCIQYQLHTGKAYNAIQTMDRLGIIKLSLEFGRKTEVQFLVSSKQTVYYLDQSMKTAVIGKTILRIYTGIFDKPIAIDLELISDKCGQSTEEVIKQLKQFEKDKVISLNLATTDASITFIEPREDDRTINRISKMVEKQNRHKKDQVAAVINFIENDTTCKSIQLLRYFGDQSAVPCGICSVCAKQKSIPSAKEKRLIANALLTLLEEKVLSSREICESSSFSEPKTLLVLQQLVEAQKIMLTPTNKYTLK
ncbi:RecQ family ATP-dependent DNA helicase [Planktosalinus lacus]|uniref:ATP-dependent DNA helicase RecQ n=1 Tax=Planktosalinus lacus TaxID=1526573 RepID=A0A8J2Y8D5_9FLAO|nr:RecQ family ATP-dependent DNA helicase [Planktosalinus lacus]GGE01478.1 ATP-dependent DNA helicase RecQ2 [Planktosalinus lacus]